VLCIFLAGGLHPCAGHFISEHYVFPHLDATQETYSYYGKLNWLTWNVGYHNEHHDFPYVPWSRLPALKKLAPEFYDNLAVCDSWTGVIWDYIMRDELGPYNRVKRQPPAGVSVAHVKED
jgi:sphingolipid delta-4 desaturase